MSEPDYSENPHVKKLELVLELLGQDNNRLKSSLLDEYFAKRKLPLPTNFLDKEQEDIETEVKLNMMDKVGQLQVEKSDNEIQEELKKRSSHTFDEEVSHNIHFITCTSDIMASIKHEDVVDESVTDDDPLSDASSKVGNAVSILNAQKFNTIIEGEFLTDERSIFFDWGGREGKPMQPDHNYVAITFSGSRPCIGRPTPTQHYSVLCLLCSKTMEKDEFYHHLAAQHYRAELLKSFPALWAVPLAAIKSRLMELVGDGYAGRIVPSSSTAAERQHVRLAEMDEQIPPKVRKDRFYIGNDEFYLAKDQKCLIETQDYGEAQHATPTLQLRQPYIPTSLHPAKLRNFHRQPLRRFSHGPVSSPAAWHGVRSLQKHQRRMERWRAAEREAGGGDIFLMREHKDLSGRDGDLVLVEYSEQYPPLLSFVGMSSKLKNFHRRLAVSGSEPNYQYGELTYVDSSDSPFLGSLGPGQTLQAVENKLYRCPVYQQPFTDFVVVRTREEYSVREADLLLVAGQQCPLLEVPRPNSKRANDFCRDFMQVFIYRLFRASPSNPPRLQMSAIKHAFPEMGEAFIRKRLKPVAVFHRTGLNADCWVLRPETRLPAEDELQALVQPEQCAAYFSMLAAQQRLRDCGYSEKSILCKEGQEDSEEELLAAPWNTSRAFLQAGRCKSLLQLTGPADPTGPAGQAFSYVRVSNKNSKLLKQAKEKEAEQKMIVAGTDADLRKLSLADAKAHLKRNGVTDEEIRMLKTVGRWDIINYVRTLDTMKIKNGDKGIEPLKFCRGNRYSNAESKERYQSDCQRIFDLQNEVLSSQEVLLSDQDEGDESCSENIDGEIKNVENPKGDNTTQVLRITREFEDVTGKTFTRTEIVKDSALIESYVKVKKVMAEREKKREKRRMQEKLRRLKRKQTKEEIAGYTLEVKKQKKEQK